ncbi:hypothetical protein [Actinomyces minihominis]|uniref:hypothetical protein n=1 Tax=Actinomyces minihominis TaxID=2002838 RepID=UPI00101AEC19|nr:hypothetical protein [Actinomyces minihominis]
MRTLSNETLPRWMRRGGSAVAGILALTLMVASCSSAPAPEAEVESVNAESWYARSQAWQPETVVTSLPIDDAEAEELRAAWLQSSAVGLGLNGVDLPDIPLERWVGDAERWQAIADCANDLGFSAEVDGVNSGIHIDMGGSENEEVELANNLALYACFAKFTPEPKLLRESGREQFAVDYEYYTTFYLECLAAHGIEVTTPAPTKEAFIAAMLAQDTTSPGYWLPPLEDWSVEGDEGIEFKIDEICPQMPPASASYG